MASLTYDDFYNYLNEVFTDYQELNTLLRKKLEAIKDDNMDEINKLIKDEQAFVLKAKSFDRRLTKYKEALSLPEKNLIDVIDDMPQTEQERFRDMHGKVSKLFADITTMNDRCRDLLETKLHVIDEILKAPQKNIASPGEPLNNNIINTSV